VDPTDSVSQIQSEIPMGSRVLGAGVVGGTMLGRSDGLDVTDTVGDSDRLEYLLVQVLLARSLVIQQHQNCRYQDQFHPLPAVPKMHHAPLFDNALILTKK
jgi:hypothetical protein